MSNHNCEGSGESIENERLGLEAARTIVMLKEFFRVNSVSDESAFAVMSTFSACMLLERGLREEHLDGYFEEFRRSFKLLLENGTVLEEMKELE